MVTVKNMLKAISSGILIGISVVAVSSYVNSEVNNGIRSHDSEHFRWKYYEKNNKKNFELKLNN
jgi:hypothetical protein